MSRKSSHYLVALAMAAAAVLLRRALDPWLGDRLTFSTLYAAVAAMAWLGGWRPALLTAAAGYLAFDWYFVGPRGALGLTTPSDVVSFLLYLLMSGILIGLGETARRALEHDRARVVALERQGEERERLLAVVSAAERREREAHERLRLALDSAEGALAELDLGTGEMTWDESLHRLLGYEPGTVRPTLGLLRAHIHPDDLGSVEAEARRRMKEGRPYSIAHRLRLGDGTVRWVHSCGHARRGPDGQPRTLVTVTFDITSRQVAELSLAESERALRAANAELSEADRRKDEFLAMLAHELRNPLGAIGNSVQLLQRSAGDDPSLALARDIISRQMKHLTRIIDDLLDVSRVTQGKITLQREPVDLEAALRLGLEMTRSGIDARRQRLLLTTAPVRVLGDLSRLAQIFANLLNNASKFSEVEAPIAVSLVVEGNEAVVSVVDQGVGIRPAMLERIFEVFVQGDQPLDRSRGGLGIGLALARALAELHGGSLRAVSDGPGHGSSFEVRLPLLASPSPTGAALGSELRPEATALTGGPPASA